MTDDTIIKLARKAGFTWEPMGNIIGPLRRFAELVAACEREIITITEIADASRVLEWMRDPNRKPAQLAFTHGPERQAAYWIEIAQSEPEVAANNIDARFTHRLAIVLECMILNPTRFYDEACALLDEYKSAWEEVNPSPPIFMGEPMPPERVARLMKMKAERDAKK